VGQRCLQALRELLRVAMRPEMHEEETRLLVQHVIVNRSDLEIGARQPDAIDVASHDGPRFAERFGDPGPIVVGEGGAEKSRGQQDSRKQGR
jgi:hypothetical protein